MYLKIIELKLIIIKFGFPEDINTCLLGENTGKLCYLYSDWSGVAVDQHHCWLTHANIEKIRGSISSAAKLAVFDRLQQWNVNVSMLTYSQ